MTRQPAHRRKSTTSNPPTASTRKARAGQDKRSQSSQSRLARRSMLYLVAIVVGVLLAGMGVILLRSHSTVPGGISVFLALVLFLAASRQQPTEVVLPRANLPEIIGFWAPISVLVLALILAILAVFEVAQPRLPANIQMAAISWILSLLFMITGVLWLQGSRPRAQALVEWVKVHGAELAVALGIGALALVMRLYALEHYPHPWSGDEASVGIAGRDVLKSVKLDLFTASWAGQPILSFYPTALALAIFGNTILASRVVSAVAGALTVLTVYGLGRELFGRSVATLAAVFLASLPYHLQFSRIGVTTVFDGLNVTLVLWLIFRAVRKDRLSDYLWAGIATGLSLYSFAGSRLVVALAFAALGYIAIRRKGFIQGHLRHLAVFGGAALIVMGPMACFFAGHPDVFMDRLGQVGILFNGWLVRTAASTGRSVASILLDQFLRSTLVYVSEPALGIFYSSPEPYLTVLGAVFFLIGLGFSFSHILDEPYAVMLGWFWAVIILGGVLTLNPPPQTRLFMNSPAIALFLSLGFLRVPKMWQLGLSAAAIAVLFTQNVIFYFGTLRQTNYYKDPNAEVAMEAGKELQALGSQYSFYLIGSPRVSAGFPTLQFLAPSNPRADLLPEQVTAIDLSTHLPALIVAIPENETALADLARRYPGGEWIAVNSETRHDPLYYAYSVPGP
jgi:4-amino-4-deoxy-L-arabinose transferase-like glycosyltransferase